MTSLEAQRFGELVHGTGALLCTYMGSSGKMGVGKTWCRIILCVRDQWECVEFCIGTDDKPTEILWVRISGQTNMGDILRMSTADHPIRQK